MAQNHKRPTKLNGAFGNGVTPIVAAPNDPSRWAYYRLDGIPIKVEHYAGDEVKSVQVLKRSTEGVIEWQTDNGYYFRLRDEGEAIDRDHFDRMVAEFIQSRPAAGVILEFERRP